MEQVGKCPTTKADMTSNNYIWLYDYMYVIYLLDSTIDPIRCPASPTTKIGTF